MTQQQPSPSDPLVGEVRFRAPLPILIPLAAVLTIAAVAIGFALVLLAIPTEAATTVALATAANVLIAAGILASRKRVGQTSAIEMGVIVLYPVVIGIVIALLGIGEGTEHGGGDEPAPAPVSGPVEAGGTMVAKDISFATDEIVLPASEAADVTLDNQDAAPHNIYIYSDAAAADALDTSAALFEGADVAAGSSETYSLPALDAGEYPFLCQIHPAMRGIVTVE